MNPATGKRQLSFFGEEAELAMGAEADEEIVSTVGLYEDPDIAAYVEAGRLVKRVVGGAP
ncbi:MAG TPA: hypothetical protein VNJ70_15645 [Thermoanaerobaculia bacterium]|nr:hypothetical protein [Thermoanaerobaculia bacterium]